MKINQSLMILLGLLFVTGTLASSQQQTSAFTFTNSDFEGVCTAADRGSRPCTRQIAQGCLCYNDGTCIETGVNKCSDCSRDDVFSVTLGACPKVQPALCPPTNPAVHLMCTRELYEACVCTTDGKCSVRSANKCSDCQNENILAIFRGDKCPAEYLQKKVDNDDEFTPKKCPNYNGALVKCSSAPEPGCACYKDGTCEYVTDGNTCTLCAVKDSKVVSFNPGQKCPAKTTKPHNPFIPKKCPNYNGAMVRCSTEPTPGCACYKDGTCKYVTEGNTCTLCAVTDTNVVSFNPEEKCPAKPVKPTKPVFIPKKCPNTNWALVRCSSQPEPGCACYKDGTCADLTEGNTCSLCSRSDSGIVSFNPGEKCPVKPTKPHDFIPKECPNINWSAVRCSSTPEPGCACYEDGTCADLTEGNTCLICGFSDPKVISFNPGEKCPVRPTKPHHHHDDHHDHHHHHHHHHGKSRNVYKHRRSHNDGDDQCEEFSHKYMHQKSRSTTRTRRYSFCKNRNVW